MTKMEPIPKTYKPWLIACIVVLVGSLFLLAAAVVAAFTFFSQAATPLWVAVLGGLAVFGIGLGFAGFVGLMLLAEYRSWQEAKRVQIIPPEHPVA